MIPNPEPERKYPWQGEFDADRANTVEAGIGSVSAVGCFGGGESPYGAEEIAGNVWEWTRSRWDRFEYPYDPDDGRERIDSISNRERRVLRGGAFSYASRLARCAYRSWDYPDYRDGNIRVSDGGVSVQALISDPLIL